MVGADKGAEGADREPDHRIVMEQIFAWLETDQGAIITIAFLLAIIVILTIWSKIPEDY